MISANSVRANEHFKLKDFKTTEDILARCCVTLNVLSVFYSISNGIN